jgi:hypothetical protein
MSSECITKKVIISNPSYLLKKDLFNKYWESTDDITSAPRIYQDDLGESTATTSDDGKVGYCHFI